MTLWDFAVAVHAAPGVDANLLELQDNHDQCVSLLLWRLWAMREGRRVAGEDLLAALACARLWDGAAVAPLRNVRRAVKAPHPPIPDAARQAVREQVAQAERAAERLLLEALESLTPAAAGGGEAPLAVLAAVAEAWGRPAPDAALERLIAGAL